MRPDMVRPNFIAIDCTVNYLANVVQAIYQLYSTAV